MARTLERLRTQYASSAKVPMGGGGGRGPAARGMSGKPKDAAATIRRLLGYTKKYRLRLVGVLVCGVGAMLVFL